MKKYPLKRVVFIIVVSIIIIFSNYKYFTSGVTLQNPTKIYKGTECGIILSNFTELINVKHGTKTDYYLQIKFNDRTCIKKVTAETFLESKVGENICFDKNESINFILYLFILLEFIVVFLCLIFLIVEIICWVFDIKF